MASTTSTMRFRSNRTAARKRLSRWPRALIQTVPGQMPGRLSNHLEPRQDLPPPLTQSIRLHLLTRREIGGWCLDRGRTAFTLFSLTRTRDCDCNQTQPSTPLPRAEIHPPARKGHSSIPITADTTTLRRSTFVAME